MLATIVSKRQESLAFFSAALSCSLDGIRSPAGDGVLQPANHISRAITTTTLAGRGNLNLNKEACINNRLLLSFPVIYKIRAFVRGGKKAVQQIPISPGVKSGKQQ